MKTNSLDQQGGPQRPMRVLVVSNTIPRQGGGGGDTRLLQLLHHLSAHCEVHFLPIPHDGYNLVQVETFQTACPAVRLLDLAAVRAPRPQQLPPPALPRRAAQRVAHLWPGDPPYRAKWTPAYRQVVAAAFHQILAAGCYDVVQIEHSELAAWSALVGGRSRVALDYQDVVTAQLQTYIRLYPAWWAKLAVLVEWEKFRRYERHWAAQLDLCLVMSAAEGQRLRRLQPQARLAVVPNGVDTAYFQPAPGAPQTHRLVFTGSMAHGPNVDAMEFFCGAMLPRLRAHVPEVTLDIVGQNPAPAICALPAQHPGVRVTGAVPDVRPYIQDAAVYVAPVRLGGGTRLKILEALACGKAVVATSFACEGQGLRDGEHLLVRDDPATFAAAVRGLLTDPATARGLGQRGRAFVAAHYDWVRIGTSLFNHYRRLSGQGVR